MHKTSTEKTNGKAAKLGNNHGAAGGLRWPDCATLPTAEIVDRLADNPHVLDAIGAELRKNEISDQWNKAYAVLRAVLESERKGVEFLTVQLEAAKITLDLAGHTAGAAASAPSLTIAEV